MSWGEWELIVFLKDLVDHPIDGRNFSGVTAYSREQTSNDRHHYIRPQKPARKKELADDARPILLRFAIELRRHGFNSAGTAAAHGVTPTGQIQGASLHEPLIGEFVRENSVTQGSKLDYHGIPTYRITVNDRLESNERFVTFAHELGHIFCGHLGGCTVQFSKNKESGWPDRQSLGKYEKEIEAEAVAYMVSSRAGVVTRSASYLATYAQKANMMEIDEDLIVRAAARIERLSKLHYGSMAFSAPN